MGYSTLKNYTLKYFWLFEVIPLALVIINYFTLGYFKLFHCELFYGIAP